MNENLRYLKLSEVATVARTSVSTVRHWLWTGRLKSIKPGRLRLISEADLFAFLEGGAQ